MSIMKTESFRDVASALERQLKKKQGSHALVK